MVLPHVHLIILPTRHSPTHTLYGVVSPASHTVGLDLALCIQSVDPPQCRCSVYVLTKN